MGQSLWIVLVIIALILIVGGVYHFSTMGGWVGQDTEMQNSTSTGNQESNTALNSVSNNNTNDTNTGGLTPSGPMHYTIDITGFAYSPTTLNIKTGDTVTWTNKDSVSHTVTSDTGSELNSQLLSREQSYEHTFMTSGTYDYHCTPHPMMKAKVIVS